MADSKPKNPLQPTLILPAATGRPTRNIMLSADLESHAPLSTAVSGNQYTVCYPRNPMGNAETNLFQTSQGLDALATTPGTDTPSGPKTLTWRTWPESEHKRIDLLWHTFAGTHTARCGTLVGLTLTESGTPSGVLVLLEAAGKLDKQERAIPAIRITCLREHDGETLLGPNHTRELDLALLLDNAERWLHSYAKTNIVKKHAEAFTTLATRLGADDTLRTTALDQAITTAKDPNAANNRRNAVG